MNKPHGYRSTARMSSPMYLAALVLMVAYCKSDTVQPKDVEPRRCYQCSGASCGTRPPLTATCPAERPFCATVASAPNYTSSLTCASGGDLPCSLTYSAKHTLELICVCTAHLCNAPFSKDLQQELITFTLADIPKNRTDYIKIFWKHSHLVNDNDVHVYKKITMKVLEATESPISNASEMSMASTSAPVRTQTQAGHYAGHYGRQYGGIGGAPRAEMLRQETTVPSDDDEDESEGSGTEDDPHSSSTAPDAPAAPSSYLPADDNDAYRPFLALIATVPAFFYLLM